MQKDVQLTMITFVLDYNYYTIMIIVVVVVVGGAVVVPIHSIILGCSISR